MSKYTLAITFDAKDGASAEDLARAVLEQVTEWDEERLLGEFTWRIGKA